jgi:hypothetical protein
MPLREYLSGSEGLEALKNILAGSQQAGQRGLESAQDKITSELIDESQFRAEEGISEEDGIPTISPSDISALSKETGLPIEAIKGGAGGIESFQLKRTPGSLTEIDETAQEQLKKSGLEEDLIPDIGDQISTSRFNKLLTLGEKKKTGKGKGIIEKEQAQTDIRFGKVKSLLKNTMAELKGKVIIQGGRGKGEGIWGNLKGEIGLLGHKLKPEWESFKKFSQVKRYKGQLNETAFAMVGILTGQNRMIEGIYNRVVGTLPGEFGETLLSGAGKLEQSLRNTYGFVKAIQDAGIDLDKYSDEDLMNPDSEINQRLGNISPLPLTDEEDKQIEDLVFEMITVEPAKSVVERLQERGISEIPLGKEQTKQKPKLRYIGEE